MAEEPVTPQPAASEATAPEPPAPGPAAPQTGGSRVPGGRQVLVVAAAVVLGVLLVEAVSVNVGAVGDAFGRFPVTILVLVGVTVFVLLSIAVRRR